MLEELPKGPFEWITASPNAREINRHLLAEYNALYSALLQTVPEGRMKSLALTALEESSHWAVKAIAAGVA